MHKASYDMAGLAKAALTQPHLSTAVSSRNHIKKLLFFRATRISVARLDGTIVRCFIPPARKLNASGRGGPGNTTVMVTEIGS